VVVVVLVVVVVAVVMGLWCHASLSSLDSPSQRRCVAAADRQSHA
jgi:hypothetical protein